MVVRLNSGGVEGVDAYPVELEVDFVRQGLPGFTMVGLAETAVREAKDRVFAALRLAASSCPRHALPLTLPRRGGAKAGRATTCRWRWGCLPLRALSRRSLCRACILPGSFRSTGRCAR